MGSLRSSRSLRELIAGEWRPKLPLRWKGELEGSNTIEEEEEEEEGDLEEEEEDGEDNN